MQVLFEQAFMQVVKRHAAIKKLVQKKVDMILADSTAIGEPHGHRKPQLSRFRARFNNGRFR